MQPTFAFCFIQVTTCTEKPFVASLRKLAILVITFVQVLLKTQFNNLDNFSHLKAPLEPIRMHDILKHTYLFKPVPRIVEYAEQWRW